MTAITKSTYRKGDRVVPSGRGRTATWPKSPGTITRSLSRTTVEVRWGGAQFSTDEMELAEIEPASGESED